MRLTVLGGSGAWPAPGGGCSGYLVEHDGFRLLLDPGYATVPRLLGLLPAAEVDAVLVTHGHPDHCADLNPLLRARVLGGGAPVLPVHALPGALDAVLALDEPPMLDAAYELHDLAATTQIGPFAVRSARLPHFVPNLGVRLAAGDTTLAYTGDAAPDDAAVELARDADVLLAEASFVDAVPERQRGGLNTAAEVGRQATAARVARLVLAHLFPTTDPVAARAAAAVSFSGPVAVATPGYVG
jgi:ribonuclease BN (tRNA processing enzyme)